MTTYTISADTLRALFFARAEQAKEYRTQLAKPDGIANATELYRPFLGYGRKVKGAVSNLGKSTGANVTFVNGSTFNVWLPLARISAWVKASRAEFFTLTILPNRTPVRTLQYCPDRAKVTGLKFTRADGGSVIFYGHTEKTPDGIARQLYGDAITLTAPVEGGEFRLAN